jgi:hypothetical protein
LQRLAGCIDRGLNQVHTDQEEIRRQVKDVGQVAATLEPGNGSTKKRQAEFVALREEFHGSNDAHQQHLAKVMESFEPGLFVGGGAADLPQDNLDLERWFRLPKGHERRIHGHSHAGVRIVQEGPTLVLVLDAHQARQGPFTAEELHPYRSSVPPHSQRQAIHRRKIMRKARSPKKRRLLLAELEARYQDES